MNEFQPTNFDDNTKKEGHFWGKFLTAAAMGISFGSFACLTVFALIKSPLGEDALSRFTTEQPAVIQATAEQTTEKVTVPEAKVQVSGNTLEDVSAIVDDVMPCMVSIGASWTEVSSVMGMQMEEEVSSGASGFIIRDGSGEGETEILIVTNAHAVYDTEKVTVTLADGTELEAGVKGCDTDMDLALISISADQLGVATKAAIKSVTLGSSDGLKVGQPVIAIGNAMGVGQSVTTGVISALDCAVGGGMDEYGNIFGSDERTMIQSSAPISPGSSGGVLLDKQGRVIGINTMKSNDYMAEAIGYAIPISDAVPIIDDFMTREARVRLSLEKSGFLGIRGVTVTESESVAFGMPQGTYVSEVISGGGAEKSGLHKGDIITEVDGDTIMSIESLQDKLRYYSPGETVKAVIYRGNAGEYSPVEIDVTLGERTE